jgi:hypothetical protein
MDATPSDLGASFLSWPAQSAQDFELTRGQGKSIQVQTNRASDRIGFRLTCSNRENAQFLIKSISLQSPLNFTFPAQVEIGEFAFKPAIFTISTLLKGKFDISLSNSSCEFL